MIIHLEQCFPLPANKDELHAQIKFVIGELISIDYEFRKQFSPTHCLPIVLTMLFEGEFPFLKAGESNWIWLSSRRVEVFFIVSSDDKRPWPISTNSAKLDDLKSTIIVKAAREKANDQAGSRQRASFVWHLYSDLDKHEMNDVAEIFSLSFPFAFRLHKKISVRPISSAY